MKLSRQEERQFAHLASQLGDRPLTRCGVRRSAGLVMAAGIGVAAGGLAPSPWAIGVGLLVAGVALNLLAATALFGALDDPEDRIDRRATLGACVLSLFGAVLTVVAVEADWSLWVGVIGLSAMAAADMMGGVILRRWLGRPRLVSWPSDTRWARSADGDGRGP